VALSAAASDRRVALVIWLALFRQPFVSAAESRGQSSATGAQTQLAAAPANGAVNRLPARASAVFPSTAMQGVASYVRTVSGQNPEQHDDGPLGASASRAVRLGFSAGVALADPLQESEALAMLQKIADAARDLNYTGTSSTSKLTKSRLRAFGHFADARANTRNRNPDGPRREIMPKQR